jgi:PAS domain S-box-containing protein
MNGAQTSYGPAERLLVLSAELDKAETVETGVTCAIELAETVFDQPVVSVLGHDSNGTLSIIESAAPSSIRVDGVPDQMSERVVERLGERDASADDIPKATVDTDPREPLQAEILVPVGRDRVLRLGVTDPAGVDKAAVAVVEGIAANLETALARIDRQQPAAQDRDITRTTARDRSTPTGRRPGTEGQDWGEASALRRLNELTVGTGEFDETIKRLLSLGCDRFGLDTGILSHVDGDDYEVDAVVDASGTHEAGAVYDLGETMCQATLAGGAAESLAFADIADTDHRSHPAAENVRAYIAAPVVVDGEAYGTVNFSMGRPRSGAFTPEDEEFVKLIAQWVGTEIERRRQFEELERYETVLEAVGDPVYALDADGRFTFVNDAAQREFGYGAEIIGERPSVAMDESDVERIQEQIEELLATGDQSTTAEFELETDEGTRKVVENRLALLGDEEFQGTAGVLRDVTARNKRQRRLESFQRAIGEAADGIAVLEDEEYTYVDQSHVDMYGFDDREQLLGNTWRTLYDDDEVERLEQEAFPALESEGYWRGMVTGSRLDGSTFPAELSLTIIEDGRLVCAVRDETERRERERELELKERAMDEASVGIQITDPTQEDNPLVYVNDGFERMTGYTREDALGRNPRFLQGEGSDPEHVARLREAISVEEPVSLELRNERKDGTSYWSRLSVTPVADESGAVRNYIGIQQDVTERKERERQVEARRDLLKRIYEVTTDPELTFEKKITGLLEAGRDHLDLPYGFLTRIEMEEEEESDIQNIVEALGSHELLQPGESGPLDQSYCRKTIERDGPMALTHAAEAGWADDLAHETFELETYIGTEVVAGDDLYGTLCFASKEPRERPFDEFERSFIRLVGQWAGYEIDRRNSREELRQQRERLELTLSGTNTGLAEWDLETDAVTWNETLVETVGRDVDSIEEFKTVVHSDDRERVQQELESMVDTGDAWAGEFRVLDDGGDTLWLRTRATATYTDGGEPVRVLATGTDISDKKNAERERRRNERRFESLFEDPGALVGLLDTDGTVLEVNQTALEYVDIPSEDVRGERFSETPWWNHSEDLQADLEEWIQRAANGEYVDYEATHPGPDGDTRHVTGTIRPVADESGSTESLVILGRDVTERERQRRELRDRQQKLDLALSNSDTSIAEIDLERGTVEWDEIPGNNTIGSPETFDAFLETIHPDDRASVQSAIEGVTSGGEPPDTEFRLGDEDSGVRWLTAQAALITDEDGDPTGRIMGIATDITELKQREQALEASRERYRGLAENIPNGGVLTFDADLEYTLAAGELLPELGLEPSDISGAEAGTVIPDSDAADELVSRFRAALDGERTDRRVELRDRTVRIQLVPLTPDARETTESRGLVLAQDVTEEAQRKQELFEERERFRLLVESVEEYAFLVVGEDGAIQTWNDSAETLFGYDTDTALGMSMAELHPEDDRESGLPDRLLQQARIAGESAHEGWRVRADGSEFYADVRHAPLEADDGEFRGYAMIVRDMTEPRRQRRRTERFVEKSDDVVTIVDTEGKITYASGSADRVLGYDPDDIVGENLFDYLHRDDREYALKTFYECVDGEKNVTSECRLRSPDGGWFNVEGRCRNMLDNDAVDGILVYLRDVTESKERARRFESIFNQTFQFTGLLEPDGTVTEVNDAALEFGGFERDAIVGEPFSDASWWSHSEDVRDDLKGALDRAAGGEFVRYETEVRGAEGLSQIDFSVKPVNNEDGDVSMLVVEGRDISSQRRQRQNLKVMQRVMRHNMRNDLTKIRGWANLMCEEPDPQKRAERLETIEQILERWEAMTEKISEIRQTLQSQQSQLDERDTKSLIEEAVAPIREEYADTTVVTDVSDAGSTEVPAALTKPVGELVENAAKVRNDATIEVGIARLEDGWTEISVRDDGPGLPDAEAETLETGEETPLNHGEGLGLWMVRTVITQAGGDVSVESTADGTEVCLRLPTRRGVRTDT